MSSADRARNFKLVLDLNTVNTSNFYSKASTNSDSMKSTLDEANQYLETYRKFIILTNLHCNIMITKMF